MPPPLSLIVGDEFVYLGTVVFNEVLLFFPPCLFFPLPPSFIPAHSSSSPSLFPSLPHPFAPSISTLTSLSQVTLYKWMVGIGGYDYFFESYPDREPYAGNITSSPLSPLPSLLPRSSFPFSSLYNSFPFSLYFISLSCSVLERLPRVLLLHSI